MPILTSANLANAILKLVAVDALPALMGNLVMGNLVNCNYGPSLAQAGDTVNIVVPVNGQLENARIILDTHAEVTFQIPDVTKVLAVPDLLKLYMQPAVTALAERIESDLLALASQFTDNSPVGSPGTPVESVIDSAENALFAAGVLAGATKYLVVEPYTYSQLRQSPQFTEYYSAGEAGLRGLIEGRVGKMKDFFIFRSQFVQKTGSSPLVTRNLAFARDVIALVVRRLPPPLPGTGAIVEYAEIGGFGVRVTMSYQPSTLAQFFTVDLLYGAGVLRNKFGIQVLS
jgi:hypothetical protein